MAVVARPIVANARSLLQHEGGVDKRPLGTAFTLASADPRTVFGRTDDRFVDDYCSGFGAVVFCQTHLGLVQAEFFELNDGIGREMAANFHELLVSKR